MRVIRWLAAFFEQGKPQSSSRLIAFLCLALAVPVVAALDAYVYVALKYRLALNADVIFSFGKVLGFLIGGGAVAIVVRSKDPIDAKEAPNAAESIS
jgi:hypothetical protein